MDKPLLRYSMLIEWSEEDQAYLVTLPEWADRVMMPATHGDTYSEAVMNPGLESQGLPLIERWGGEPRFSWRT